MRGSPVNVPGIERRESTLLPDETSTRHRCVSVSVQLHNVVAVVRIERKATLCSSRYGRYCRWKVKGSLADRLLIDWKLDAKRLPDSPIERGSCEPTSRRFEIFNAPRTLPSQAFEKRPPSLIHLLHNRSSFTRIVTHFKFINLLLSKKESNEIRN